MFNQETLDSIESIYYGKDHVCRCGCAGTYAKPGSTLFTYRINKIKKLDMTEVDIENDGDLTNYSLPNDKAFTIYFK